jgi:hypothetical protein
MTTLSALPPRSELEARFAALLPVIERYAPMVTRLRCPGLREDALAELTGLTWAYFLHLAAKGRDASQFPASLVYRAAQHVRAGRRLCGQEPMKDPLSWTCQRRRGFTVDRLPDFAKLEGDAFDEALHDNTQTPPPEQAAFRCDWPAFLQTRSERDRALIGQMALGERTRDLADAFGLSPARVSQLRQEFRADWYEFVGDVQE